MFNLNKIVEWRSGNSSKLKQGKIIAIVPPKGDPLKIIDNHPTLPGNARSRFQYGGGLTRDHESYIIEVPGATPKQSPKYYWPVVSQLKKVGL